MLAGVIDIGTNSIKLLIGTYTEGAVEPVIEETDIVRMGENLIQTGAFSPEAMDRGHTTLCRFAKILSEHRVEAVRVVGTMGLRSAANGPEFIARVLRDTGMTIEILPGSEEARLSFMAATSRIPGEGPRVVFDTGGGSTEIILGCGAQIKDRVSLTLGALFLHDEFLKHHDSVPEEQCQKAMGAARRILREEASSIFKAAAKAPMTGIGGTVTTLASVAINMKKYDAYDVVGYRLTLDEVAAQREMYRRMTVDERRSIAGLSPKRVEIILGGACIVEAMMQIANKEYLFVSDRGLRYGVLEELFTKSSSLPAE